ncbi:70 kDa peptidyl-prolyl isomerase-like [Cucumis melo var. makuwa]|uniref:peptidylprolyl isomerase n=1 Tax=Cucumis melo var. makuwa TaxID=1194695 RepID=A0A5D3BA17_CUCMM|nr:70 kDa peptidyl-prolyl isomerase-like [Cucumis melo var. makuwa]TYJ95726.1 70 kDa peptidyl-prolyl isomerase-like [Cucumis melo var. makuwa]
MAESVLMDAFVTGLERELRIEGPWAKKEEAQNQTSNKTIEGKKGHETYTLQITIPIRGSYAKREPTVKRLFDSEFRACLDKVNEDEETEEADETEGEETETVELKRIEIIEETQTTTTRGESFVDRALNPWMWDKKVLKKTQKEGERYGQPNVGAVVQVKLIGKLADETIFTKKGDNERPFEFKIDEVTEGLNLAVRKMKGEIALVIIHPQYAFGSFDLSQGLVVVPQSQLYITKLNWFHSSKYV